jgi:hypothetical protein
MKAFLLSILYALILLTKGLVAKVAFPFAYLVKDWVYGKDEIKHYYMPAGVQESWLKWCFWIWLGDSQPLGYSIRYAKEVLNNDLSTTLKRFWAAYMWSACRNPAYNINYVYLSNMSRIIEHKVIFGKYEWDMKLRAKNGTDGVQLVTYRTVKGQDRFLFSCAYKSLPLVNLPFTFYWGWNTSQEGRFTVAMKFTD